MTPAEEGFEKKDNSQELPLSNSFRERDKLDTFDIFATGFINSRSLSESCLTFAKMLRDPQFSWEKLSSVVTQKACILGKSAEIRDFSFGNHSGHFNPETTIRIAPGLKSFQLNDISFFTDSFISSCRRYVATNTSERGVFVQAPLIAMGAVSRYFSSFLQYDPNFDRDKLFEIEDRDFRKSSLSLSDLKYKTFADSTERAPLYAQALSLLGFEVLTCRGEMRSAHSKPKSEYMFSLLKTEKGYALHDISNPVIKTQLDGHQQVIPAITRIDSSTSNTFLSGKPITVPHCDLNQLRDGSFIGVSSSRTYKLMIPII